MRCQTACKADRESPKSDQTSDRHGRAHRIAAGSLREERWQALLAELWPAVRVRVRMVPKTAHLCDLPRHDPGREEEQQEEESNAFRLERLSRCV